MSKETYWAIVDEAAKQGRKTVGHIPNAFKGQLKEAFAPHLGIVAHAEEFSKHAANFSYEEAKRFAGMAKYNRMWFSPTLIVMVWIASQARSLDSLRALGCTSICASPFTMQMADSKWLQPEQHTGTCCLF